jgi:hypothetical protein
VIDLPVFGIDRGSLLFEAAGAAVPPGAEAMAMIEAATDVLVIPNLPLRFNQSAACWLPHGTISVGLT